MAFRHARVSISIHAPRGGSDFLTVPNTGLGEEISIHAPRGGSDVIDHSTPGSQMTISIHAPRGGSDMEQIAHLQPHGNFNPRSPWGERRLWIFIRPLRGGISIHAPRGGSDQISAWQI